VEFGWSVLGLTGLDLNYRGAMPWDKVKGEVFAWQPTEGEGETLVSKSKIYDAVDLLYRNICGEMHNINRLLPQMKTRTLVVHVANDQWLIVEKARAAYEAIPGAQFFSFSSPLAHYAVFDAPYLIADDAIGGAFLRDIGVMHDEDTRYDAENYRTPSVALQGDPMKSFWETQVVYPFPVKYAEVKDKRGQTWKIGYMDEYAGKQKNPPALVIVHGKGAFGGHYGYLMKYAIERGLRVITPDMPGYGMSGPGNLDKPNRTRTLQDVRDMFNELIVKQLGVKKAYYLGHSLGGQTVLGYALSYPDAVSGLILEGPAGLEEFPTTLPVGEKSLPLFDPALAYDEVKWKAAWGPTGAYDSELNKQPQAVRDFFYFRKTDPETGAVTEIPMGYFMRDSEYARLHTDQRIAMINSNPKELEQWVFYFIYDVYSIGSELRKEDPNNLYQRLTQIKAPIFMAFGAQEPFIPSTSLNGLQDMANEVINPFIERMRLAGNPLTVKIYPEVGHFIHTDVPYEFAKDTVDFIQTGRVQAVSPKVVDALVNGARKAAVSAGAGAAAAKPAGFSK
jgi:pimeloyl-ACP methyl ester carboxylesterase